MPASLDGLTGAAPSATIAPPPPAAIARFAERSPSWYESHYEKALRRCAEREDGRAEMLLRFLPSWNWAAFCLTVPWLFYRKMYLGGIILVALPVFLDHILPGSLFLGSGLMIAMTAGVCGNSWYVEHAVRRLTKARRAYPDGQMREAFLARARGVSVSAGVFGILIQVVTATVVVMDLLPPNRF
jgi:hypothetical protein